MGQDLVIVDFQDHGELLRKQQYPSQDRPRSVQLNAASDAVWR